MRKYLMGSAVALIVAACGAATAGTYIPVPMVPGTVSQIVFSINNHNVVAGSFRDSANVEHGFFGPLDGSNWTTFDAPFEGTTGTEPRYIGDDGAITGIALNPKFKVGEQFYRAPDGIFSVFEKDSQPLDGVAQGLNAKDASFGDYINLDGKTLGYKGKSGAYLRDFKLHLHGNGKFPQISPRGIDNLGQIEVGYFKDLAGVQHGFVQVHAPRSYYRVIVIDYPNSKSSTALEDVNEFGLYPGQWTDSEGDTHAFLMKWGRARGITFMDLDPEDGSASQQAWGVNDDKLVAISTSIGRSYIYCPKKNSLKCPSGGIAAKGRAITISSNARQ